MFYLRNDVLIYYRLTSAGKVIIIFVMYVFPWLVIPVKSITYILEGNVIFDVFCSFILYLKIYFELKSQIVHTQLIFKYFSLVLNVTVNDIVSLKNCFVHVVFMGILFLNLQFWTVFYIDNEYTTVFFRSKIMLLFQSDFFLYVKTNHAFFYIF